MRVGKRVGFRCGCGQTREGAQIVYTCTSLEDDETELNSVDDAWSMNQVTVSHEEQTRAAECRDNIAKAMWDDFTARQTRRRR
jgi:hypothetical protein